MILWNVRTDRWPILIVIITGLVPAGDIVIVNFEAIFVFSLALFRFLV